MMMFSHATKSSKSKPPKGNLILQTTVVAQPMYLLVSRKPITLRSSTQEQKPLARIKLYFSRKKQD
jgi:hypothetical protein